MFESGVWLAVLVSVLGVTVAITVLLLICATVKSEGDYIAKEDKTKCDKFIGVAGLVCTILALITICVLCFFLKDLT